MRSTVLGPVGVLQNGFRGGDGMVGENPGKGQSLEINERPCKLKCES